MEEVKQSVGIKESKELLAMVKVLAMAAKRVSADGKVDASDLGELVEVLKNMSLLVEGVKGLDLVDDELKDVDSAELQELGAEVMAIILAVKAA